MWRVIFVIPVLLIICGCKDSPNELDEDQFVLEASIKSCEELLANPKLPERARAKTKKVLEQRRNNVLDPAPVLVQALLTQPKTKGPAYLAPWISDEDGDLVGIGVREYHKGASEDSTVIEEEYPVFAFDVAKIASYYVVPVSIRTDEERKNGQAWEWYLEDRVQAGRLMPDVWVSIPEPGKIDVEVWVYDRAGHKTEPVPVTNRLSVDRPGE
ncbi:MAG: hypothetical protein ACYTEX_28125 [Planctomycetota bacterium]|jgi:hypothetical protein